LGAATGAFAPDGRLVATAAVHLQPDVIPPRAVIVGQVHPELRNRGLGDYLMRWSQAQGEPLLAQTAAQPGVLQIMTESLTGPADRLYRRHGFENVFEELVMQRDLHQPLPDGLFPPGVTITDWQPGLAMEYFQVYENSFRERPGFPGLSAAEWLAGMDEDDFQPGWSPLAKLASPLARLDGMPVGFVVANIIQTSHPPDGFISEVGVIPSQRRRGLGSALMLETMRRMQADGMSSALLNVNTNNPGAIQSYLRIGFKTIGRRARYERPAGR
jgi:mycothiol synthase